MIDNWDTVFINQHTDSGKPQRTYPAWKYRTSLIFFPRPIPVTLLRFLAVFFVVGVCNFFFFSAHNNNLSVTFSVKLPSWCSCSFGYFRNKQQITKQNKRNNRNYGTVGKSMKETWKEFVHLVWKMCLQDSLCVTSWSGRGIKLLPVRLT